jgi:hypothetical protein
VKVLLFLAFFFIFFEAGLFSSYTIVTGQPPDMGELINTQIATVLGIFNFGGSTPNQQTLKILNNESTAEALKNSSGMDGINLQSLSATTLQSKDSNTILVNITAMGYKDAQTGKTKTSGETTTGSIVITPNETFSITATATAKRGSNGITIDVGTIKITSTRKIYNAVSNTST